MLTLADVPLEDRVTGALEAILSGAVGELAERYAVLAVALWPPDVDVTLRDTPAALHVERVGRAWPAETRAAAVAAYHDGEGSFSVVGARFGVPGATLNDWVQRARTAG